MNGVPGHGPADDGSAADGGSAANDGSTANCGPAADGSRSRKVVPSANGAPAHGPADDGSAAYGGSAANDGSTADDGPGADGSRSRKVVPSANGVPGHGPADDGSTAYGGPAADDGSTVHDGPGADGSRSAKVGPSAGLAPAIGGISTVNNPALLAGSALPSATTVLVIAKEPVPGRVKTRLCPPYTPEQAATLAEAALADTLEAVAGLRVRRRVLLLAGRPGPWLPGGFEVVPQVEGGLDERIAAGFALCDGPALLVGMDTPQLSGQLLAPATGSRVWEGCDAWFGPAVDGGFWALGMARPRPELVRGVPMSAPDTGEVQRRRLVEAGLAVRDLPVLRDVDTAEDAERVAAECTGRFAAVHAGLSLAGAP